MKKGIIASVVFLSVLFQSRELLAQNSAINTTGAVATTAVLLDVSKHRCF